MFNGKESVVQTQFFQSELFKSVQLNNLFDDSKTFADAIPKQSIAEILNNYQIAKQSPKFDLSQFINLHFDLPSEQELTTDVRHSCIQTQIEHLWGVLKKPADQDKNDSLIPLPHPYTVPGGRFREIYYWDSYFAALGLVAADRSQELVALVDNFVSLQHRVGLIPNGNRWYYNSRSQPPVLAMLVDLLQQHSDISQQQRQNYLAAIENEYQFWMDGADNLAEGQAFRRVVRLDECTLLNRYYDDNPAPRPESYAEDIELAAGLSPNQQQAFFRNIRAACESGWDFSSRWFTNQSDIQSIATTEIVPVDLNCMLYFTETFLAQQYQKSDANKGKHYENAAQSRAKAINNWLWSNSKQMYVDYWFKQEKQGAVLSLAGLWPLYFNLATNEQALVVRQTLEAKLEQVGGLITTNATSEQQWDAPNGWAPLHWIAILGLNNYGFSVKARTIAQKWINTVENHYQHTGVFMEKYNVVDITAKADGGEYEVQEGFGWTNGVTSALLKWLETN